jgi:glycosyltransferase involved in cell wall biosynthesis
MKISVIIPFHNAGTFLERSITSVLKEEETGEIILIDDHSTDKGYELVKCLQKEEERIILLSNDTGLTGASIARNLGVAHARFDFIAFLDADDYFLPGRFKMDAFIFLNNPEVDAVINSVQIQLREGTMKFILNSFYRHGEILGFRESFSPVLLKDYLIGFNMHLNGWTMKRSVFQQTGGFDSKLKQGEDRDFYLRLLSVAKVLSSDVNVPKAIYLIHSGNTIQKINEAIYYRRMAAKKHFFQKFPINAGIKFRIKKWKDFLEYDFLWLFQRDLPAKRWIKILLLPVFLYRLFSKTDPSFDINRSIPPTSHK